jgi:hypothetical protein
MERTTSPGILTRGDQVPHFEVRSVDDSVFVYRTIWQHKNLLLILLPDSCSDEVYASELRAHESEWQRLATQCVITREPVAGLRAPAVLIADRWGEIVCLEPARAVAIDDLLGWLEFVEQRCPECEGEAR